MFQILNTMFLWARPVIYFKNIAIEDTETFDNFKKIATLNGFYDKNGKLNKTFALYFEKFILETTHTKKEVLVCRNDLIKYMLGNGPLFDRIDKEKTIKDLKLLIASKIFNMDMHCDMNIIFYRQNPPYIKSLQNWHVYLSNISYYGYVEELQNNEFAIEIKCMGIRYDIRNYLQENPTILQKGRELEKTCTNIKITVKPYVKQTNSLS